MYPPSLSSTKTEGKRKGGDGGRVEIGNERLTADIALKEDTSAVIKIHRRLPDFLQSVKLKYVKLGYGAYSWNSLATRIKFVLGVPLSIAILVQFTGLQLNGIVPELLSSDQHFFINAAIQLVVLTTLYLLFWSTGSRPVYLVDFSCFKPAEELKTSLDGFIKPFERSELLSEESVRFLKLITKRACMGEETYVPRGLTMSSPPDCSYGAALAEAEETLFGSMDSLLGKTGLNPNDIGILIVTSSLFNPVPSLSSMIVKHYKLRTDIKTYNLGGMGCSAGLIAIDLAQNLLKANSNSYAVVVNVEILSKNWYFGNDKSKLLTNCLFRMGASAVLLSNKASDKSRSKYELGHLVRTHKGSIDEHFNCVRLEEDDHGVLGVTLSKDLMSVAGEAVKTNITTLAPLVLPWTEQLKFFATLVRKKVFRASNVKPYIPDFKLAFNHFCIHPGGKAVMDAMEEKLQLTKWDIEPSRMALHRFGNTSSSSIWYVLAYAEAKGQVKRGDRVWQLSLGSGYKCVSAVWRALGDVPADDLRSNAWGGSIHNYPVNLDGA